MKTCKGGLGWRETVLGVVAAVGLLLAGPRIVRAQTGVVQGQVIAAAGGDYLQGAQVALEGTSLGALTNRSGQFRIEGVRPGRYTLLVRYLGYADYRKEITVPSNGTVVENAALTATAIMLDELTVQIQQGQAKALSLQRAAPTITNLIDKEQMEAFPDYNTAEALQRVPGVNISRGLGEGKFVAIRGTEPRMTSVTVDGQKIATPEDEERYVALDVISSNQMASLEVTKAITPDMDADAIGGAVNLVTRSAFDLPSGQRQLQVTGGYGYARLGGKPQYEAAFTYAQLLAGDRLGLSLNGSVRQANKLTHGVESNWGDVDGPNGETIPFALLDTELRRYSSQRDRYGVGGDIEYRSPGGATRLFFRGMYNKRDDYQNRQQSRFRVDRGTYQSATRVVGARLVRGLQDRLETQYITALTAGGDHRLGTWKLDYLASYTYGEQNKNDGQIIPEFQFNGRVDMDIDLSQPEQPGFSITNYDQAYLEAPANWTLDAIDFRREFTSDQELIGVLNTGRDFALGDNSGSLKFGLKARRKEKDRHDHRWRYRWAGTGALTMEQFASSAVAEPFFHGVYRFGSTIDNGAMRAFLDEYLGTPSLREEERVEDSKGDAYEASEQIYSVYAMGTINLGRLMLLGGLRHESTRTDYAGTRLLLADDGQYEATEVADQRGYAHFFPSLHARLAVNDQTNLRFAFTTGIARANFFDLVPYLWILPESREILRGNSRLDPTYAHNLDLMFERYFQSIGVLSAGVFYKHLNDIIYTRHYTEAAGEYAGYSVEEPVNGGKARLYGIELNWQQQFTFLPGFLGGFGIYANYTYSKSEADLLYREWTTLPGQAADAGNFAISYDRYGLAARVSMNYSGSYITEVGGSPAEDRIVDDYTQWDFSGSYRVTPRLTVYLNVINFTDAPYRLYLGVPSRPRQMEYYSWASNLGLKLRLN